MVTRREPVLKTGGDKYIANPKELLEVRAKTGKKLEETRERNDDPIRYKFQSAGASSTKPLQRLCDDDILRLDTTSSCVRPMAILRDLGEECRGEGWLHLVHAGDSGQEQMDDLVSVADMSNFA